MTTSLAFLLPVLICCFSNAHEPHNAMPDQSDPPYPISDRPQDRTTTLGIIIRLWTPRIIPDRSSLDLHKWNPCRKHTITYAVDKTPIALTTLLRPHFTKVMTWNTQTHFHLSYCCIVSIAECHLHSYLLLAPAFSSSRTLVRLLSCIVHTFLCLKKILQHTFVCTYYLA
jgi:hypothetical protein